MRSSRSLLLALALSTGAAATARAQAPTSLLYYPQRASINLLGIPFGYVSGEYEAFTTEEISLGGAAGIDTDSESWLEAKVRYYPSAAGPRGIAVGLSAGLARQRAYTNDDCDFVCTDAEGPLDGGFTLGAFVDYSWLVGRRERFYIGTGVGAKRVFGLEDGTSDDGFIEDYRKVLPILRFQTGLVF